MQQSLKSRIEEIEENINIGGIKFYFNPESQLKKSDASLKILLQDAAEGIADKEGKRVEQTRDLITLLDHEISANGDKALIARGILLVAHSIEKTAPLTSRRLMSALSTTNNQEETTC